MATNYEKVRDYIMELDYSIIHEDPEEEIFVVDHEEDGIKNLVIGVADPLLIIEQFMFDIKNESSMIYKDLLMKNRDIVHGAFVLDENGSKVIFRDTLQIENLDLNELEASVTSLSLLLTEYSENLIEFSKN